jgi:hypothetical protein
VPPPAPPSAASDEAARAARRARFEAPGPAPPRPKPWWGGVFPSLQAAVSAAAHTLFRVARRSCTSLLAASLHGAATASAAPAAAPPGAAPSPHVFDAARHAGHVLRLCGGLFYVELLAPTEARARGNTTAAAAHAAQRAGTFAVCFAGDYVLASSSSEAALNALLAAAAAAPCTLKRAIVARGVALDTVRSLAAWRGPVLPALLAAVQHSTAIVDAAARAEGTVREARSLLVRATGHLLYSDMIGSVAWDTPSTLVPATAWLRGWTNATLQATGVVPPSGRPSPRDPREIVAASGWRLRTRSEVHPFQRQPFKPGEVPTWDVAAVCDAWEAAHGPLAETDLMWTLFGQMSLFEPVFDAALHTQVAAATGALVFPGGDKPHVTTPLTHEAETVKIPELLSSGINSELAPAAALGHGNVISAMIFVPKSKLKPPAELAPVLGADDGRATPVSLAAIARAAQQHARDMTAELQLEIAAGMAPALAAEVVLARRGTPGPVRACHDGRALSEYITCTASEPQTIADLLRGQPHGQDLRVGLCELLLHVCDRPALPPFLRATLRRL